MLKGAVASLMIISPLVNFATSKKWPLAFISIPLI